MTLGVADNPQHDSALFGQTGNARFFALLFHVSNLDLE
jgi:hypothetical protein